MKEFSSSTKLAYDNLKTQSKTPLWMFAGLAFVGLFIIFSSYKSKLSNERNAALIQAPVKGDVFEIKTKDRHYTLYKVASVEGDSVFLRFNNYETNKITGLLELKEKGDAAYSDETFSLAKSELKQMLDKGEIQDIERP